MKLDSKMELDKKVDSKMEPIGAKNSSIEVLPAGKQKSSCLDEVRIHAGPIGSRTTTGICREPARF